MRLEEFKAKIDNENDKFNNLTSAEKRVVIAQDCLARISMNQFNIKKGTFLALITGKSFSSYSSGTSDVTCSVKDEINSNPEFQCKACAKGALFLSYVGRVNEVNFEDVTTSNSINDDDHTKLLELFSAEQLSLIEYIFEGRQYINYEPSIQDVTENNRAFWRCGNPISFSYEIFQKVESLKAKFSEEERLIFICENIIKNEGTLIL